MNDCCGGTLGALVQDQNNGVYILSNNHVLAESDQGRPGDTIVQPALIDLNCNPQAGQSAGVLRYVVPLSSPDTNVDAALAAATPAVDPSGAILQIGPSEHGTLSAAPPAGGTGEALTAATLDQLRVVKSGRTTGLTCSTVDSIDLRVQVDYYSDCAETQPLYTKTFTGQLGIPGKGFADSGDSGALVMDAANAEPIGLLFASGGGAGHNGFTIANPIRDVLDELNQSSQSGGLQFQIAGGAPHPVSCSNYDGTAVQIPERPLGAAQLSAAQAAVETASGILSTENGVLAIEAGRSLDRQDEAAVIVYVDRNKGNVAVPKTIDGVRTRVVPSDESEMQQNQPPTLPQTGIHLGAASLREASKVEQQYAPRLMRDPAFFGVGVAQSYDNSSEAALLVLVDPRKTPESMPDIVGGMRVRYLAIDRLHVTRSRDSTRIQPTSCELKAGENRLFAEPPLASGSH